MVAISSKMNG